MFFVFVTPIFLSNITQHKSFLTRISKIFIISCKGISCASCFRIFTFRKSLGWWLSTRLFNFEFHLSTTLLVLSLSMNIPQLIRNFLRCPPTAKRNSQLKWGSRCSFSGRFYMIRSHPSSTRSIGKYLKQHTSYTWVLYTHFSCTP